MSCHFVWTKGIWLYGKWYFENCTCSGQGELYSKVRSTQGNLCILHYTHVFCFKLHLLSVHATDSFTVRKMIPFPVLMSHVYFWSEFLLRARQATPAKFFMICTTFWVKSAKSVKFGLFAQSLSYEWIICNTCLLRAMTLQLLCFYCHTRSILKF
jgi:hypothetical protein